VYSVEAAVGMAFLYQTAIDHQIFARHPPCRESFLEALPTQPAASGGVLSSRDSSACLAQRNMLDSRRLIIQRAVTRLTRSGGSRPELRLLDAAAQAGIVSVARIRLDSGNLRDLSKG
jgi:hypothetical protein